MRIHPGSEIRREEAVALEPARGHEDENPECSIAEPEARRCRLRIEPHHQVHALEVTVVYTPNLLGPSRVGGQLLEAAHRFHVHLSAEFVVARNASFTMPEDVGGRQVHDRSVRLLETL